MSKTYAPDEVINFGKFLADHGAKPKKSKAPHVWRDPYQHKPYKSPLSQNEISSRAQRREEMVKHNVREVEPSEGPHRDGKRFNNPDYARRHGINPER